MSRGYVVLPLLFVYTGALRNVLRAPFLAQDGPFFVFFAMYNTLKYHRLATI